MTDDKPPKPSETADPKWWVAVDGSVLGPYGRGYILAALRGGQLLGTTTICLVGNQQWSPIRDWGDFGAHAGPPPTIPPLPPNSTTPMLRHPLINPRLPTMANWICVYCIAINPMLWVFNNLLCLMSYFTQVWGSHAEVFSIVLVRLVASVLTAALVVGGLRLRDLHPSGAAITKIALWIDLSLTTLLMAIVFVGLALGGSTDQQPATPSTTALDWLETLVMSAAFSFEVAALIWLHRNGKKLPYTVR